MHCIPDIDRQITELLKPVPAIAAAIKMPLICGLEDQAAIDSETSFRGLYRIDVSTAGPQGDLVQWFASFKADWECDGAKGGKSSALVNKRLLQQGASGVDAGVRRQVQKRGSACCEPHPPSVLLVDIRLEAEGPPRAILERISLARYRAHGCQL